MGLSPLGKEVERIRRQAEEDRRQAEENRRQAEEDRRREEERRRQEQGYQSVLNGRSPRAMYLLAAEMIQKGERGKAKELYRRIMKEFPNDDLAIKAADQLNRV